MCPGDGNRGGRCKDCPIRSADAVFFLSRHVQVHVHTLCEYWTRLYRPKPSQAKPSQPNPYLLALIQAVANPIPNVEPSTKTVDERAKAPTRH